MKILNNQLMWGLGILVAGVVMVVGMSGCTAVMPGALTASKSVSAEGDLKLDTSSPGTIGFDATTQVLSQSWGSGSFAVYRTGGTTGAVSVSYATGAGTAVAGTDYTPVSGTLSWADGDTSVKTITMQDLIASPFAGKRTVHITLSSPTGGATLGTYPVAVVSMEDTYTPPSTLFDFSSWKYTPPIDIYRGTGGTGGIQFAAETIQPSVLTAGFADAYFYASGSNVVFNDVSNGATTSPGSGSDHTRSELRELYTGPGHDSNSDWTSVIGRTLTATCTIQSVSADSDEATIGQIHGQSSVFMLLIYRPANHDVQVVTYTINGGSTATRATVVTGVNLGDTITYSIHYSGSVVTTVVNGVTNTYSVDSSWAGTPVYFKLGSYHAAPNTGNPAGDATKVSFSAFSVTP